MLAWLLSFGAASCPSDVTGVTMSNAIHLDSSTVCSFSITHCIFKSIRGTSISVCESSSVVSISGSVFEHCTNTENTWANSNWNVPIGGAAYIYGLNASISRCCGYRCSSVACHFCALRAAKWEKSTSFVSSLTLLICGNDQISQSLCQDAIDVSRGHQIIEMVNSTLNEVREDGAGLEFDTSVSLKMCQCSVSHCKGSSIVSAFIPDSVLSGFRVLSMVNVVNNTGTAVSFMGNSTLQHWIFIANKGNHVDRWYDGTFPVASKQNLTLLDCVSDKEVTGNSFILTNHRVEESAKSHTFYPPFLCPWNVTSAFTSDAIWPSYKIRITMFLYFMPRVLL